MDTRAEKPNRSLTQPSPQTRLLAVYPCLQRFGFAVFKGPTQLLDWGGGAFSVRNGDSSLAICGRICPLLKIYAPEVLVVRKVASGEGERYAEIRPIMSAIKKQAAKQSVEFELVGREEVRRTFERFGTTTKYDIAARVATLFPELMWKLPPPRKSWQTEYYNMAIFDAASLGIAYFSRFGEGGSCSPNAVEDSQGAT